MSQYTPFKISNCNIDYSQESKDILKNYLLFGIQDIIIFWIC